MGLKHIRDLRTALPLFKCLGSEIRISILELLYQKGSLRMTDIAEELGISNGSLSPHIKQLYENGLITISFSSGKHGVQRICSVCDQQLLLDPEYKSRNVNVYETEIGVGQYTGYEVYPTCGLSTPDHLIGAEDDPRYFASPERVNAGILWLGHGYVDYMIPNYIKADQELIELQISLELASEAPGFSEDWPSDITFSINGVSLCQWTSPADFGKEQGIYTPSWWDRNWNQHGQFKLLSVNESGTYVDGGKRSDVTLTQLGILSETPISLRIAAPKDAPNAGGLTIYGRSFGNYDQDIRVRMHYKLNAEKRCEPSPSLVHKS